ncbi:helix-turn-helix domain-containing protein [Aestuariibacter halophilus]|uniref:Helix-turn-helix domain-containing protein n=1 Tax=Fluctibacter halophilus TaxID=226011 RepID=A0ABS8G5W3_9ALTE|nr:helix-turn-helix domain-containing protein [Aestuariibacter halophilus]
MKGGAVIRGARLERGYTQESLSKQYGIAVNSLHNYETCRTEPGFTTVYEILEFLGYDISEAQRLEQVSAANDCGRAKRTA